MTKNENRINKLFEELVPTSGKADSLAGELVRATARIGYRFFNDGDMVNQGYGKETCNPAARFLIAKGNAEISSLTVALWEIFSEMRKAAAAQNTVQLPLFVAVICGSDYRNWPRYSSTERVISLEKSELYLRLQKAVHHCSKGALPAL